MGVRRVCIGCLRVRTGGERDPGRFLVLPRRWPISGLCEAFDCIETPTGRDGEIYERLQHLWNNSHDTYVFGAKFRDEMEFLLAPQLVDDALLEYVRGMKYDQPSLHAFLSVRIGMNIVGLLTD